MKGITKWVFYTVPCFCILWAVATLAHGQTVSGTLRGTVTDVNGALVPNATVVVKSTETGLERTVVTSGDGLYNVPFLPIGAYIVEISRNDFNKVTRENVRITLNETTVLNVELNPSVSGEVTITDEAPPINTTNAQIAQSLSTQQIQERPVFNQSSFLTLAQTFTGYQENPTSTSADLPTLSIGSSINFNGTGTRGATFQINGVNNDDSSENQNRQGASLATIKEFQVISNNFTAEFGRGYGAVVLVQTKSGTNNLDGSAYWFHNNSSLNAKDFRNHAAQPVNRRNQFGGVVGFPIWRDKLFGFASIDRVENSGAATVTKDIPTDFERNPANWFLDSPANNTAANRAFIQSFMDRFGDLRPNRGTTPKAWIGAQGFNRPANDFSTRIDWNATSKDTVYGRYQLTDQLFENDEIIVGEQTDQHNKQSNFGLNWTHLFTPEIVGEFRYGLGWRKTRVDILAGNDTPVIRVANPFAVTGGSIVGNAGAFPIHRDQLDHQFVYNLSWGIGGNHFLKLGTDIRRQSLNDLADNFSRGFWNITGACGGNSYREPSNNAVSGWRALINGCVTTFQKGYGPFELENRIGEANFYAEDNWKITRNLTLNLGFRYEYVSAPTEANDLVDYVMEDDDDNFEPRIGFAWSPDFQSGFLNTLFGDSGSSSIRGGYGIYHGRIFQSVFSQSGATVRFNPPNAFFYNQTGVPTALFNPFNLQDPTNGFVFTPGTPTTRHSITIIDPGLEMPYTQQWNLTYERQLPWSSSLRLSYTGNRGIGLLKYSLGNLPIHDPNGVLVANHPNNAAAVRGMVVRPAADPFCAGTLTLPGVLATPECPNAVPIAVNEYSLRRPYTNERRPDPRYTSNLTTSNAAWSYYNGLQVEWAKRLSQNLNFTTNYTWSKTIDTTSEASFVGGGDSNQNGNDAKVSRGLSRWHTPHRFTFFGTYRSPFFDKDKGVLGQILGGWESSLVFRWSHGTPFTVTGTAFDLNFDGFSETRPALVDPSILGNNVSDPETSRSRLPQSAFRRPNTVADFGCCILGRNTFFGDGTRYVDLAFTKRFPMPWEGHSLTLRADLFNAFNKVEWGFPATDYTLATLGTISTPATSYAPRSIQVSLKYYF